MTKQYYLAHPNQLYLDLETRSQTDLFFYGLKRYAQCPTTQLICMYWCFDDGPVQGWFPEDGAPFPQEVIDHIKSGGEIWAHNASFERHLFEYGLSNEYDFDAPAIEQWRCSMIAALVCGYPAGLDGLATALGGRYKKNPQGTRLIREYCSPGFLTEWKPGDKEIMGEYCGSDVEVMRECIPYLRDLTADEWADYHLNERVSDRGLPVDVEMAEAAAQYTYQMADDANVSIAELTGGVMTKHTQRKARDAWLFPKLTEHQRGLLDYYKNDVKKTSLDADHRALLLLCEDLDPDARELLELMNDAGSSALKKYGVAAHQHVDGRVHNAIQFHGAQPGRFSGRGLQPHNFRRDVLKPEDALDAIKLMKQGGEFERPSITLGRVMRSLIYHPDGLAWVDWSAIQGRIAPWLCNTPEGEEKLKLYWHADEKPDDEARDVYRVMAAKMFGGVPADVDNNLRQTGKVAELSLQFGGSHGALMGMARGYGQSMSQPEAEPVVKLWRRANPWAVPIWEAYDRAISRAVRNPGQAFEAGRVTFQADAGNFLWCALPSGNLLAYPKPRWEMYTTPWGEERVGATFQSHFKPKAGEPPIRMHARGALIFQNTVQAVEAVILREALREADADGLDIAGHVHDEAIVYGRRPEGERLNEIMLEQPWWAEGLPIATGGVSTGERWGK